MKRMTLSMLALLSTCSTAAAHEFWIEPASFHAPAGSVLRLGLWLGERFAGAPVLRDETMIEKFLVIGPDGEGPVVGRSGSPIHFLRTKSPGVHAIGFQSRPAYVELTPEKFEKYLKDEGLADVIDRRRERGEQNRSGREAFRRCAKSLVLSVADGKATAGESTTTGFDRRLGMPLEIVALDNPRTIEPGGELSALVEWRGQPLAGAQIVAVHKSDPSRLLKANTDSQGRVRFRLDKPGAWLLTTIHMERARSDPRADWESYWASLTFELPGANAR
jgi:hypothetical protein